MRSTGILTSICVLAFALSVSAASSNSPGKEKEMASGCDPKMMSSHIAERAQDIFSTAPGLTDEQRKKLLEIVQSTARQAIEIRMQINEAKTDLFKVASSKAFSSKEVGQIRDKITALDQKRLQVMYKALEDVQVIVGFGPEKQEFYRRLRDYDQSEGRQMSRRE